MSNVPSTIQNESPELPHESLGDAKSLLGTASELVATPVQFAGFWSAVALPLAYLPFLYGGLPGGDVTPLVAVVVVHAIALLVGYNHRRE